MLKRTIIAASPREMTTEEADILANNIFVQGHMWGFRRWLLQKDYTIDQYIAMQTKILLQTIQYSATET